MGVEALAAQRVEHVAVQLVEVGGDHLDRLMGAQAPRPTRTGTRTEGRETRALALPPSPSSTPEP